MQKRRGSYQVGEARRESILSKAFEVFAKEGFRGGSLRQIAERAGISEAGLLHHFKSKGDLLTAVLDYRDVGTEYNLMTDAAESGEKFILRWLELIEYNTANKGIVELFCILSAESTSPKHPAHGYFKNRYAEVLEISTGYFQMLKDEGMLKPKLEPRDLARTLLALSDGLQVQWLLDPTWDMLESHRAFFRGVLNPEFEYLVAVEDARDYKPELGN
ncbi:MAG: hypothetical protein RIR16_421 [Actinomycetota bacterium]|jgi:AcrR family transcriptional regulator